MRFVQKDLNDKPNILTKQTTLDLLERIATTADTSLIKDDVYKDPYKDADGRPRSKVLDKLNDYYFGKCAYCETLCKADIEHYRPKKGVTEDKTHKGYYWLCYEWSNLVPGCPDCNARGGKANQFPIIGKRVEKPTFKNDDKIDKIHSLAAETTLFNEKPYLIHPEIDDPKQFFTFKIGIDKNGIEIVGKDKTTKRGEKSIKICNLNRNNLQLARLQNVVGNIVSSIDTMFVLLLNNKITKEQLPDALSISFKQTTDNSQKPHIEHTLLWQNLATDFKIFDALVVSQLADNQKKTVRAAFQKFISHNV